MTRHKHETESQIEETPIEAPVSDQPVSGDQPMSHADMHRAIRIAASAPPILGDAIHAASSAGGSIWAIFAILIAHKDDILAAIQALMALAAKLKPAPTS